MSVNSCSSGLTEDSFTIGDTSYQVTDFGRALIQGGGANALSLTLSNAISRNWTLHVDDRRFRLADATLVDSDKTANWSNPGFTWTVGQKVSLRLTAVVDASPSVFQSAAVDEKTLTVTFTENLDTGSVPSPGAFRVTVNNARRNVASGGVAISGKTVRLTLASAVSLTDTVKVRYSRPSAKPLQGAYGRAVATFADRAVTNNTQATIWSATLTAKDLGGNGFPSWVAVL